MESVVAFKRGDQITNEHNLPTKSIFDEVSEWVRNRGKDRARKKKAFDSGAIIMDTSNAPGPAAAEAAMSSCGAEAAAAATPAAAAAISARAEPGRTKSDGACVICFEENPRCCSTAVSYTHLTLPTNREV